MWGGGVCPLGTLVLPFPKLVDIPEYHESVDEQHAVLVYRIIDDEVK